MEISEERWEKAVKHAREMLAIYQETSLGVFAATMIQEDIRLYEEGDRSEALLETLEGIS